MEEETKELLIKMLVFVSAKQKWPLSEWIAKLVLEHLIEVGCFNNG